MSNGSSNKTLWIGLSSAAAACPSLFCCFIAFTTFMGATTYETEVGGTTSAGTVNPMMGFVFLCLALVPWLLPAGVWFYFRRKEEASLPPSSGGGFTPTVGGTWQSS